MDNHMDQLGQIANSIQQAYANDVKGLIRLHLSVATALSQELSIDLTKCMLSLESVGEQPDEVVNFTDTSNIHLKILDL
jgi:hypothetical protein